MTGEVPISDWQEPCLLKPQDGEERTGPLVDLVQIATRLDPLDRPQYLLVSPSLGELDNDQIEGLRRRLDFPA